MASLTKTKEAMVDRCLIAASLAALVCHPSSTIKCFKPKPRSPQEDKLKDSKRHYSSPPKDPKRQVKEEGPSKPKKNLHPHNGSCSPSKHKKQKKPIKAVSELAGKDHPSFGIVESIVRSGWVSSEVGLKIEKVLWVHHSKNVLQSFEEYRQDVKSTYKGRILKKMERLVVDGNELLQFLGATVACSLGINGETCIFQRKCCQVCRMIASEFSGHDDGTMSFFENSWRAHQKVGREGLKKKRVCARKAIVMCRVIAGRIAHFHAHGLMDNEGGEFDSVMAWTGDQFSDSKELLVLNSEAVLPCFVIIYKVEKPSRFRRKQIFQSVSCDRLKMFQSKD